jgi:hypothetical protein
LLLDINFLKSIFEICFNYEYLLVQLSNLHFCFLSLRAQSFLTLNYFSFIIFESNLQLLLLFIKLVINSNSFSKLLLHLSNYIFKLKDSILQKFFLRLYIFCLLFFLKNNLLHFLIEYRLQLSNSLFLSLLHLYHHSFVHSYLL